MLVFLINVDCGSSMGKIGYVCWMSSMHLINQFVYGELKHETLADNKRYSYKNCSRTLCFILSYIHWYQREVWYKITQRRYKHQGVTKAVCSMSRSL